MLPLATNVGNGITDSIKKQRDKRKKKFALRNDHFCSSA
jgi:hypothetical protein